MLTGGRQDDCLVGGAGKDQLLGEEGSDVLSGGTGVDELEGRGDTDDTCVGIDPLDEVIDCGADGADDPATESPGTEPQPGAQPSEDSGTTGSGGEQAGGGTGGNGSATGPTAAGPREPSETPSPQHESSGALEDPASVLPLDLADMPGVTGS